MKKVGSSQAYFLINSCTESTKTQLFPVIIIKQILLKFGNIFSVT